MHPALEHFVIKSDPEEVALNIIIPYHGVVHTTLTVHQVINYEVHVANLLHSGDLEVLLCTGSGQEE